MLRTLEFRLLLLFASQLVFLLEYINQTSWLHLTEFCAMTLTKNLSNESYRRQQQTQKVDQLPFVFVSYIPSDQCRYSNVHGNLSLFENEFRTKGVIVNNGLLFGNFFLLAYAQHSIIILTNMRFHFNSSERRNE